MYNANEEAIGLSTIQHSLLFSQAKGIKVKINGMTYKKTQVTWIKHKRQNLIYRKVTTSTWTIFKLFTL